MTARALKKKKPPKKIQVKEEDNLVLNCSREKMEAALQLIEERMKARKERTRPLKIQKCKSIPGTISAAARINFMTGSLTHKSVQLRNALISHNWKDASFLLLNMLKYPKYSLLYRNMWKAFFLILQHSPHADYTRMEQFRELCRQLSGKDNFLEAVYL